MEKVKEQIKLVWKHSISCCHLTLSIKKNYNYNFKRNSYDVFGLFSKQVYERKKNALHIFEITYITNKTREKLVQSTEEFRYI